MKDMPCLYDIHTHQSAPAVEDGCEVKSLVNVFPLYFDDIKSKSSGSTFSCGVHPWYSADYSHQLSMLDEIAKDRTVVAIGETGLDKLKGLTIDIQKDIFRQHIRLSEKYQKPLIIHCVKAWDELIAMNKDSKPHMPWIIHGYRGNAQQVAQLISLGFMFSIGERYNQDAVKIIPSSSLFCETDMSPSPIVSIYQRVADTRGISLQQLSRIIEENVKKIFCKF